jgi:hypothetical protein
MVKKNKFQRVVIRTALSAAMLLTATSASAVLVDGSLSDLTTAIANETLPGNKVTATESGTDSGGGGAYGTTSSGSDITNGYAWYDVASDTLFMGMSFIGQVGTSGDREGATSGLYFTCSNGFGNARGTAGVFDGCESYGFNISVAGDSYNNAVDYAFNVKGESIANSGQGSEQTPAITNDTLGLGVAAVDWAVSETFNGVEFSVTGLMPILDPFSIANPRDVTIRLFAGSGSNRALEDELVMQMQVVPVPAAIWLLGSGLLGLLGVSAQQRRI